MTKILFLLFLLTLASCAHDFHGGRPTSTADRDNYRIDAIDVHQASLRDQKVYKLKTVVPLIKDVSPEAYKSYRKMAPHRSFQELGPLLILATLLVPDSSRTAALLGTAGLVFGHQFYLSSRYEKEVSEPYNRNLDAKFAPSVSWTSPF